jgi:hypothetical protein
VARPDVRSGPPSEGDSDMNSLLTGSMLAQEGGGMFSWWQGVLLLVLIGLIVFYFQYRKKQM